MTDGRCFGEQHGRCPTVPGEARHSDFLVPVHSMDGWAARLARSAAGYSAKAARWKVERGSDDCSTAEEPACSGAGCRSMAARWRVERDSTDYRGMTAGNSAAHSRGDCLVVPRPQAGLAD